jgi:hypothetical protein
MRPIPVAELQAMHLPLDSIEQRSIPSPEALQRGIYQPLVTGEFEGEVSLLWGRQSLCVAAAAEVETLSCLEMGPVTAVEAVRAVLMAENRPGAWELPELVPLIEVLDRAAQDELQELIDGPRRGLLDQARKTAALGEPVRDMVLSGVVTLRHGEELAELPRELIEALRKAMERGSFSLRREILQMSVELYKRYREEEPGIVEVIIGALEASDPRGKLYELRFPSYSAARREIESFRAGRLKGTGITLQEPPNLEGDAFSLIIPFSSPEELRDRLRKAERAAEAVGPITELLG